MHTGSKEYSLEELLEHPVLGVQMTSEGIDRRGLDLVFDAASRHNRLKEGDTSKPSACSFVP